MNLIREVSLWRFKMFFNFHSSSDYNDKGWHFRGRKCLFKLNYVVMMQLITTIFYISFPNTTYTNFFWSQNNLFTLNERITLYEVYFSSPHKSTMLQKISIAFRGPLFYLSHCTIKKQHIHTTYLVVVY
jgi:hypothetical protein